MTNFVLFALLGLGSGALIAGLSLSVVLTFRGSGVINLATGSMAMLGAYVFLGLRGGGYLSVPPIPFTPSEIHLGKPWPLAPALIVSLAVCGVTGALIDGLVFRRLRNAAPLAKLVATLGIFLTMQSAIILRFGSDAQPAPTVLPTWTVPILGVSVPFNRFILVAIVVVATVVLAVGYRVSRFGIATRAASENERLATLSGLSPNRLSMVNTVMASLLAGALGILVAPISQLDPNLLALSVIPALAAALIARFTSFPIAAAAGLGIGVVESLITWLQTMSWFPTSAGSPVPGVSDVFIFIVIIVVLSFRGSLLPERGATIEKRLPYAPRPKYSLMRTLIFVGLGLVALVAFPFDYRQALINSIIGAVMLLAYVVLTGFVGQVSLLPAALAGVAALLISQLAIEAGIGFPYAPLLGIVVSVVVGLACAISALRIRGVSLAIVTMAAAIAIGNFWFGNLSFGINSTNQPVSGPILFGVNFGPHADFIFGDRGTPSPVFGFVCLLTLLAAALVVMAIRRGTLGQRMLAVRSNERAAAAAGISVQGVKLSAYAISSALAGIAGVLYGYDFGSVSADQFSVVIALSLVAYAYIGGITSVTGAVIGGLLIANGFIAYASSVLGISVNYQLFLAGLALILIVTQFPEGLAGAFTSMGARMRMARGGLGLRETLARPIDTLDRSVS
jgi:branched-chain amino acid transport system permease protein